MIPRIPTLLLILAASTHAAVVFEIETQDHSDSPPIVEEIRMAAEGNRLLMEIQGDQGQRDGRMIFHADRRELVVIHPAMQTYAIMDLPTIRQMGAKLGQAQAQLDAAMQNVPAAQRAMVEQMMRDRLANQQHATSSQTEVRRVGDQATVNGYPCIRYEVYRDGHKVRDLWVTEWRNVEGGREIAPLFEQLGQFFDEMQAALPANQSAIDDNMFTSLSQLNGFPIASRDYHANGTTDTEAVLRTSGRQQIDPAVFEPPAGYRRQQMFGGGQ